MPVPQETYREWSDRQARESEAFDAELRWLEQSADYAPTRRPVRRPAPTPDEIENARIDAMNAAIYRHVLPSLTVAEAVAILAGDNPRPEIVSAMEHGYRQGLDHHRQRDERPSPRPECPPMPPTAPDAPFDAEAELEAAWQDGLEAAHHGRPLASVYSLWTAFSPMPDAIRNRIEAGYRYGLEDLELFRRDMEMNAA